MMSQQRVNINKETEGIEMNQTEVLVRKVTLTEI